MPSQGSLQTPSPWLRRKKTPWKLDKRASWCVRDGCDVARLHWTTRSRNSPLSTPSIPLFRPESSRKLGDEMGSKSAVGPLFRSPSRTQRRAPGCYRGGRKGTGGWDGRRSKPGRISFRKGDLEPFERDTSSVSKGTGFGFVTTKRHVDRTGS